MAVAEHEIYKRIKLLGEGSFGKAYLVECVSDGSKCVIKQMDLNSMSDAEKRETIKEAKILEALKHPNIIRFREVYKTKKGKLCICMDYADGGDLTSKIKEQRGKYFSENQILDWFTQLCLSVKHCHDRKIIHRDLKCQNIFLTKQQTIKLGDFGIARILKETKQLARTVVGTPYYLSPEIIDNKPYSFKTDIWSIGVILYELCTLKPPFNAESLQLLFLKILKGQYAPIPNIYSKELRNLVTLLLQSKIDKRPTVHEILKLPVITERIKNFLSESISKNEFAHTILHKQQFVDQRPIKMSDIQDIENYNLNKQKQLQEQQKAKQQQIQAQQPIFQKNKSEQESRQQSPPTRISSQQQIKPVLQQANKYDAQKQQLQQRPSQQQNIQQQQKPLNYHYQQIMNQQNQQKQSVDIPQQKEQKDQRKRIQSSQQQQQPQRPVTNQQPSSQQQQLFYQPPSTGNRQKDRIPSGNAEKQIGGGGLLMNPFYEKNQKQNQVQVNNKPKVSAQQQVQKKIINNEQKILQQQQAADLYKQKAEKQKKLADEKAKQQQQKLAEQKQQLLEEKQKQKDQYEKMRIEKEKQREEERKRMLDDIAKKKKMAKSNDAVENNIEWRGSIQPGKVNTEPDIQLQNQYEPLSNNGQYKIDDYNDLNEQVIDDVTQQQINDQENEQLQYLQELCELVQDIKQDVKDVNDKVAELPDHQLNQDIFDYETILISQNILIKKNANNQVNNNQMMKEVEYNDNDDRDDDLDDNQNEENDESKDNQKDNKIEQLLQQEESLSYISDFNKLEKLKMVLEDAFGLDNFIEAYKTLKQKLNEFEDISEIEQRYSKDYYIQLFPKLSLEQRKKHLPLLFTLLVIEEQIEKDIAVETKN